MEKILSRTPKSENYQNPSGYFQQFIGFHTNFNYHHHRRGHRRVRNHSWELDLSC